MRSLLILLTLTIFLSGCGLPRDQRGSLDRIEGETLRAGIISSSMEDGDRRLLGLLADQLNADLEIQTGESHALLDRLENGELDIVASLPKDTPFQSTGQSRPFGGPRDAQRVWAVRAGENALLLVVNAHLAEAEEGT